MLILQFGFSNWNGVPDNYQEIEHCIHLLVGNYGPLGKWNDIDCNYRIGYICKKGAPGKDKRKTVCLPFHGKNQEGRSVGRSIFSPFFSFLLLFFFFEIISFVKATLRNVMGEENFYF